MPRELSTNPKQIRHRMRRKLADIQDEIYRLKPLEEWDWEELRRGYPRKSDGRFGHKPEWAGFQLVDNEVQRRLAQMTAANLKSYSRHALRTIVELLKDERTDLDGVPITSSAVRLKAAEFIIEHTIGKPQSNVQIDAGEDFKSFLAGIMVNDDGEDAHPITIPGVVVDDEDEEDDEY